MKFSQVLALFGAYLAVAAAVPLGRWFCLPFLMCPICNTDVERIMCTVRSAVCEYSYSNGHKRADFEAGVTSKLHKSHPDFNFVICEPKHDYNFTGEQHIDWDHTLVWYAGKSKSYYYDLVVGHQGKFCNRGDLRNWAFSGSDWKKDPHNPGCVEFHD